jgi:hypothetical protein
MRQSALKINQMIKLRPKTLIIILGIISGLTDLATRNASDVVKGLTGYTMSKVSIATNLATIFEKHKAGTLQTEDFAGLASATASTLAGIGIAAGTVASSAVIVKIAAIASAGLFLYDQRGKIKEVWNAVNPDHPIKLSDGDITAWVLDNVTMPDFPYPNFPEIPQENLPIPEYNPPQDNDNTDTGWGAGDKNGGCGAAGGPGQGGKDPGNAATVPRRGDPLTFDLDGDGIETTGRGNRIVFDHNADGVKNGTGWVNADDGLLVLDRDGNGTIDSGRELFGDNTIKSNGERAKNGFDALADFDLNADGKIDALDDVFANLRLWRDANQDGISQSEELLTLSDLNIASINLQNTKNNTNLNGTGNVQTLAANLFILF